MSSRGRRFDDHSTLRFWNSVSVRASAGQMGSRSQTVRGPLKGHWGEMEMKRWGWFGLIAVGCLAAVVAVRVLFPVQFLLAIALANREMHPVKSNQPVTWLQGPDVASASVDDRPPNIVVILADDLGFNDVTLHGGVAGGIVKTPHIDSIARDGVELSNGYAGNATCAPSRAAIMTGRYAPRFGFEFTPAPVGFARVITKMATAAEPGHPTIFNSDVLESVPPLDQEALPRSEITIAKMLKGRGYHTLHLGKWHLGGTAGSRPEQAGFDESLGFMAGASMYLPENDPDVINMKQPWDPIDKFLWFGTPYGVQYTGSHLFRPSRYMTDYLGDEAVNAIHANRNRPFFIYFAANAAHTPLQATKEDYAALSQIQDPRLRVYGAMVRALDRNVGKILTALKSDGLDRNTLVIFTSDNGGAAYIGLDDSNKPFRGYKATFFEGGLHVPYFVKWQNHIKPGTTYSSPVAHVDIVGMAAAAAGAALPKDRIIDGVDLLPFLTGERQGPPHRNLFWRSGDYDVVLQDGWKLQRNIFPLPGKPKHLWLYNLAADPTERTNLATSNRAKVAELEAVMNGINHQMAKPIWPSVLAGPIAIDHTSKTPIKDGDDYIYWYN